MREESSVCRICPGACGVRAEIDENGQLLRILADRDHLMSGGYICIKGRQAPEAANGKARILRPLKRLADGRFVEIALETALDEIGTKLAVILAESGPRAISLFKGTAAYFNVVHNQMMPDFLAAIGSPSFFTTITIDQSAKAVTMGRMGYWDAGRPRMRDADALMLVGTNPLLAISTQGFEMFNATKRMKDAKARGMKLIVVDPRRTETAGYADIHLQPIPGEDPTLFAGLLRIILLEGWHDAEFCAQHVDGLERLAAAVEPFTPAYVEARARVPAQQLLDAATMFARDSRNGFATTGTGATMAPHSNLADHLVECLNVVCGRLLREGDRIANPGVLTPAREFRAQAVAPSRSWESGHRGNAGYGTLNGEMMTATLADEILIEAEGRIRALIVSGGNPAVCLPDQRKAVHALQKLDLLVAIEPYMTPTAELCDYILPPRLQYERTDVLFGPELEQILDPIPFQQFIPAICSPPPGSELVEDWYVLWSLARRLGVTITFAGQALNGDTPPTTEELLAILLRHAQVPFETLRRFPQGRIFDIPEQYVAPALPGQHARLAVAPYDIVSELLTVAATPSARAGFTHRLAVRRMRELMNTVGMDLPDIRKRRPYNPAWMHPDDLAAMGIGAGASIEIRSANGAIVAIAEPDATLRPGVVSLSHCWGGLPDKDHPYDQVGISANLLVTTDRDVEPINAMAWMSAIDLTVRPYRTSVGATHGIQRI